MIEYLSILIYSNIVVAIIIPLIGSLRPRSTFLPLLSLMPQVLTLLALLVIFINESSREPSISGNIGILLAVASTIGCLLSTLALGYSPYNWISHPGVYSLIPLILLGLLHLALASNPLIILASWLLVAVTGYSLVALPGDRDSLRASLTYGVLGMTSTLLLILGISLGIIIDESRNSLLSLAISGLMISSLGLKMGLFPLHVWIPHVYGKADGRLVAVLASSYKPAFLAALTYMLSNVVNEQAQDVAAKLLLLLGLASITYGNIAALTSKTLQDILVYSSIAHAGFGVVALSAGLLAEDASVLEFALLGLSLLMVTSATSKSSLFSISPIIGKRLEDLQKLSRDKLLATSVITLSLSLLGVPPLLGFWGKLFTVLAVIHLSPILAAIVLVNVAVSSAYYMRIVLASLGRAKSLEVLTIDHFTRYAVIASGVINVLGAVFVALILQ